MSEDLEKTASQQLETAIRAMFYFTGWEQGADDEPAIAVSEVRRALDNLDAVRNVKRQANEVRRVQPCYRGNDWCPVGCCSHFDKKSNDWPVE